MVSIKTVLTLGALLIGGIVFIGAGGPSGVGQRIGGAIGGGLSQFTSSLTSAFTGGLFGGKVNEDTGTIGPAPRTGTEAFDPLGNLFGNLKGLQNILDSINNAAAGLFPKAEGAIFEPLSRTFPSGARLSAGIIFNPLGQGAKAGIRGNPLAAGALSRREPTFGGVITTKSGGTRNIRGSAALFQRLERSLAK